MTDVLIISVKDDLDDAEALADMFENAGLTVSGAPADPAEVQESAAAVLVWSRAALQSPGFLRLVRAAGAAGNGVVASLIDCLPPLRAPAFDLLAWTGDPHDPTLDRLFFAVDRLVATRRARVGPAGFEPAT